MSTFEQQRKNNLTSYITINMVDGTNHLIHMHQYGTYDIIQNKIPSFYGANPSISIKLHEKSPFLLSKYLEKEKNLYVSDLDKKERNEITASLQHYYINIASYFNISPKQIINQLDGDFDNDHFSYEDRSEALLDILCERKTTLFELKEALKRSTFFGLAKQLENKIKDFADENNNNNNNNTSDQNNVSENVTKNDNKFICNICEDKEKSIVFDPCGHVVCCVNCSIPLKTCPICRVEINKKMKWFLC